MKSLLLFLAIFATGCEFEFPVNLKYDGGAYTIRDYSVFDGVLNGNAVAFINGPGQFKCTGNFVHYYDNDQKAMNSDGTQATCIPIVYTRIGAEETNIPLVNNG